MKYKIRIITCSLVASLVTSILVAQPGDNTAVLPEPYATKSAQKFSKVIGWSNGQKPTAPAGFEVTKFAEGLGNPRLMYMAPNGDIFVAESGTRIPKQNGRMKKMPSLNLNHKTLAVPTVLRCFGIKIKMVYMKANTLTSLARASLLVCSFSTAAFM